MIKSLIKPEYLLLISILTLGLFLRLYKLESIPAGFFADEASIGYNAYTILKQGVDEHGTSYPFFFKAFGEYKNPIQTYSTVPFIFLFGLNETCVRLTSVFFGTLGILSIYLLAKELLKNHPPDKVVGLLAAFLLAISPWHIHMSRISLEGLP